LILVFGSINADLSFALDRLPVTGQTVVAERLVVQPGGKGANQAVAARRDGAVVMMVGAMVPWPLRRCRGCARPAST
jgi:ribokinase